MYKQIGTMDSSVKWDEQNIYWKK